MWPRTLVEGVGEKLEYPLPLKHYCSYMIMRGTVKHIAGSTTWIERCKCERSKHIDYKFIVEGSNSPKKTIRWYDAEGNLERITGDK